MKRDCSFSKFRTRRNNNLENVDQKFFDAKWKEAATLLIFDRSRPSTKINVSFNNAKLERSISRIREIAISICTQSSNAFAVRSRSLDDPWILSDDASTSFLRSIGVALRVDDNY